MSKKQKRRTKRKKRAGDIIINILLYVAIAIFVFSLVKIVLLLVPYYRGEKTYDQVKENAIVVDLSKKEEDKEKEQTFKVNFDLLKEQNPDTVGWIRFDEPSVISYPIVKSSDNQEYLSLTFSRTPNKLGSIFMDKDNASDFSDRNTIIYGHNMVVGEQMFTSLHDYNDEAFLHQHPYFYIYTPDNKEMRFRIFSVGEIKSEEDNYRIDFPTEESVADFLKTCKNSSYYDVDVELDNQSKIVTLSTCTDSNNSAKRFVIQGVLEE